MNIAVDCRFLDKKIGMARVTYNLLLRLKSLDSKNIFNIDLLFDKDIPDFERNFWTNLGYGVVVLKSKSYFLWEQFTVPLYCRNKYDCLIFMLNTGSIFIKPSKYVVGYVHDVIYLKSSKVVPYSKSVYKVFGRIYRNFVVPKFIKKADMIITVSNFSKEDIIHETNCNADKVKVVYNGFDGLSNSSSGNNMLDDLGDYLFIIGSIDIRKNTDLAIEYYKDFIADERFLNYKLVIAGVKDFKNSKFYEKVRKYGIEDKVISLGIVDDGTLAQLYKNAKVFLFLSSYEGFGLPILEAMSCGTPVVSSSLTCLPEISGDAAILVNPNNKNDVISQLKEVCIDMNLRNLLIERGYKRVEMFKWENAVNKLLGLIEELLIE